MGFAPSFQATADVTQRLADRVRVSLRASVDLLRPTAPDLSAQLGDLLELVPPTHSSADLFSHPELIRWQGHLNGVLRKGFALHRLDELSVTLPAVRDLANTSDLRAASSAGMRGAFDVDMDSPALREVLQEAVRRRAERRRQTGQALDRVDVEPVAVDPESASVLASSLEAIERIWPEMYDEMKSVVRLLVLFDGEAPSGKMVSFTDSSYHGAIFMKRPYLLGQATKGESAGDLLHEATHNYINASLLGGNKVFSEVVTKSFATTFRVDPRPLPGVYHQMVVLARLAEFYRRAESLGMDGFPKVEEYRPGVRGGPILDELDEMVGIIRAEAPLTEYGAEVVESVGRQLASAFGRP